MLFSATQSVFHLLSVTETWFKTRERLEGLMIFGLGMMYWDQQLALPSQHSPFRVLVSPVSTTQCFQHRSRTKWPHACISCLDGVPSSGPRARISRDPSVRRPVYSEPSENLPRVRRSDDSVLTDTDITYLFFNYRSSHR